MAFDLYFSNGEDFRERILIRSADEINSNSGIEKSRHEELKDFLRNAEFIKDEAKNEFVIVRKILDMEILKSMTQKRRK